MVLDYAVADWPCPLGRRTTCKRGGQAHTGGAYEELARTRSDVAGVTIPNDHGFRPSDWSLPLRLHLARACGSRRDGPGASAGRGRLWQRAGLQSDPPPAEMGASWWARPSNTATFCASPRYFLLIAQRVQTSHRGTIRPTSPILRTHCLPGTAGWPQSAIRGP